MAVDGTDSAVGFAMAIGIGDACWLCELSVHPAHGRRGIGTALLTAFLETGRERGCTRAGLSTFRNVPFNAPFYARHGFIETFPEAAGAALRAQFEQEIPAGIDPRDRVLMLKAL